MLYLILFFAFAIRFFPRILLPYAIADDGYHYFSDAELMRNSRFHMPDYYDKTLFKSQFGYSYHYPLLLSLFPRRVEILVESLVSPLFDTALIFCSVKFFGLVLQDAGVQNYGNLLLLFAGLMAVLPAFLKNDTGPRAYNGSARVMGQFFFLLLIFLYYYYVRTDSVWFFLGAAGVGMLLFPMATFATQVFVFTGIFIGIVYSPKYFLMVLASLVLLFVLSRGRMIKMFAPRFMHFDWYFRFYQKVTLQKWQYLTNPLVDYLKQLKLWTKLFFTLKWRSLLIYINICYNPIHFLVVSYFYYFVVGFIAPSDRLLFFLSSVCIGCLCVFVLTMLKKLLFLGESYRYLEFGVAPALMLLFYKFHGNVYFNYFIGAWIVIALIRYVFFQIDYFRRFKKENEQYSFYREFFERANPRISGNVFASVHYRTKGAYFGNFSYLGNRGFMAFKYLSLEDNYLAFGNYPHPGGDFKALIERFDLKYWLTTNKDLQYYLPHTKQYGDLMEHLELVDQDERIDTLLYRIKRNS